MEYYMEEKRKLAKDDLISHYSSTSPKSIFTRSFSIKSSTSKSPLLRSSSNKSSSHKSPLSRSSSQRSTSSKSPLSRSSSTKCSEFTRKCSNLAKEQRAKLYIVKRCVTMLVCWHKHGDS